MSAQVPKWILAVALLALLLRYACDRRDAAAAVDAMPAPSVASASTLKPASTTAVQLLTDVDGAPHTLTAPGRAATLLIFIMHDCPICNALAPEIERIRAQYAQRGVAMFLVYIEKDIDAGIIRAHAKEYGLNAPLLHDATLALAGQFNATIAPQAVILDGGGKVAYRGRINDLYQAYGKRRVEPTVHDVRDRLEALLRGDALEANDAAAPAVGCFICREKAEAGK